MLPFQETEKLIKKYRIPIPRQKLVESLEEAKKFSEKLYPVVMKVYSSKIIHKTDVGGIIVDIRNEEELTEAFKKLMKIKNAEGVIIQKYVRGIETIIGGITDEHFGPCVSFGTGGIFTEILNDIEFRVCPITKKDARKMIEESRIYRILSGYRGKKYDINPIVDILLKVAKMIEKEHIKAMDINPIIVEEKKVWAVDVRIIK
ncbi:MAG: acetate--CoA ligase family protein [Candidatus Aenigmarchaeota archaeon]|nr:acetate--CoA ligase family protein [Candidatus Aenigmarchaeota archaeon]